MKKFAERVVFGLMAAMMLLAAGCGEKKCYFVTEDSKSLTKGARVLWRNPDAAAGFDLVGKVVSLEKTETGTMISFKLKKKFDEQIYDDVAARVEFDQKCSPPRPYVLLIRGKNTKRPLLKDGDEIIEAAPKSAGEEKFGDFVYWLRTASPIHLQIALGLLLLITTVLKIITKSLKLGVIVAIICAVGYLCVTVNIDWSRYKERFANTKELAQDVKSWLIQHGEKIHSILQAGLDADDD